MRTAAALLTFIMLAAPLDAATSGDTQFAVDLYQQLRVAKGNLFFSPYSISVALAMVTAGARGDTARELQEHAHLPSSPRDLALLARELDLGPAAGVELTSANALWAQRGIPLREEYLQLVRTQFGATIGHLDFARSDAARETINTWASDKTKKKIPTLIGPGVLNGATRLVLTNAVYMKAKWLTPFAPRATADLPFHFDATNSAPVKMMWEKTYVPFAHVDGVRIVELPYVGGGLSMLIVLPDAIDGLDAVERSLTPAALDRWAAALKPHETVVRLPRFRSSSSFALEETLRNLGIRLAFRSDGGADFSGISTAEKLFIAHVIHEARIDVAEEGTEAAAATAVTVVGETAVVMPQPEMFVADHPFLYVIRKGKAVVFMGRLRDPR